MQNPRTVVEDLAGLDPLTEEEMAQTFGAGRSRLTLEPLEDRQVPSASAVSTLPVPGTQTSTVVQFKLADNMDLTETKVLSTGKLTKDWGSAAGGELFQGHDSAGHDAVFISGNGHLYEFTPDAGFGSFTQVGTASNNEIAQDRNLDLFFLQAGTLYEATGVPAAGPAGAHAVASGVQAVYQARDTAGHPAAYALEGGQLLLINGASLQPVSGVTGVAQALVDRLGHLYALAGTGVLYAVRGTTATPVSTGVTQVMVGSAGQLVVLHGAVGREYAATWNMTDAYGHVVGSLLGKAVTGEQAVPGVRGAEVVHFQGGAIYWSAATGAQVVYGAIGNEYAATVRMRDAYGRPVQPLLGLPTSGEQAVPGVRGAWVVHFQRGVIYWSEATGAHTLYGAIFSEYVATANLTDAYRQVVQSILGLPTTDEQPVPGVAGARVVHFQGGAVYWSAATGAHALYGAIGAEYNATANQTDAYGRRVQTVLGLPTVDEQGVGIGGRLVHFRGGDIVWSAGTGAHVVYGAIAASYRSLGGAGGLLGLPTTDEQAVPRGRVSHFQNGDIYWSVATGAVATTQSVRPADGSTWFLGVSAVDAAGDHAVYRLTSAGLARMPGAGTGLTVGVNGRVYLTSRGLLRCWNQTAHNWVNPAVAGTSGGLGLIDVGDVVPTSPEDAKDKWDHIVDETQQQGQILTEPVIDAAFLPAAAAGAQLYLAGAADMDVQFSQRGELLSSADKQFLRTAFAGVYSQGLLDSVVVHYGCTMPNSWYATDTQGITFGHNIYLKPGRGGLADRDRLTLIGHELMHAAQYDRLGQSLYAFGYVYFQELTKAGGQYRKNSMEQEAYNQEDRVGAVYDKAFKLHSELTTAATVTVYYQVPDPNPPSGGLYLTTPTLSKAVQLTVQPGQTAFVYDAGGQLFPVDQSYSVGGHITVKGAGPNDLWTYQLRVTGNQLELKPYFGGI